MRIATVSDLHVDFAENREAVVKLAVEIHRRQPDLVVIAGDVSHRNNHIEAALLAFQQVAPKVVYLPGNHDLWTEVPDARLIPELDTWRRYRVELRQLAEAKGAHYLPARPYLAGSVALVGTCGWYDYSLLAAWLRDKIEPDALEQKTLGGFTWSDARFTAFRHESGELMTDALVAQTMERELLAQLEEVDANPEVERIVVVTHHQPFYEVVHRTGTLPWDYFNAFMGSAGLGEVIKSSKKVAAAVYGHTHRVGAFEVGGLRVYGTPLGYPRERKGVSELEMLQTRIGWLEL